MRRKNRESEDVELRPPPHHLRGLLFTVAAVAVILYGGALLLARTEGLRSMLADYLKKETGVAVKIERTWMTPALTFHAVGLHSTEDLTPGKAGLRADRLAIRLAPWAWLRGRSGIASLKIENGVLSFAPGEDGILKPGRLAQFAGRFDPWTYLGIPNPAAVPTNSSTNSVPADSKPEDAAPESASLRFPIALQGFYVQWWGGDDNLKMEIKEMNLHLTPVELPGRSMMHFKLTAAHLAREDGDASEGLDLEFLLGGPRPVLLICRFGSADAVPTEKPSGDDVVPLFR